jgi:hypothetical protein
MVVTLNIDLYAVAACIPDSCVCPCCCKEGCPPSSFIPMSDDTGICGLDYTKTYGFTNYSGLTLPLSWSLSGGPCPGTTCLSDDALHAGSGTITYHAPAAYGNDTYYWTLDMSDSSNPPCTYSISWVTTVQCCPTDCSACPDPYNAVVTPNTFLAPFECFNGGSISGPMSQSSNCHWLGTATIECDSCDPPEIYEWGFWIECAGVEGSGPHWFFHTGGCYSWCNYDDGGDNSRSDCITDCSGLQEYEVNANWTADLGSAITNPCPPTGTFTATLDPGSLHPQGATTMTVVIS